MENDGRAPEGGAMEDRSGQGEAMSTLETPALQFVQGEPTGRAAGEPALKSARRIAHIPRIASTRACVRRDDAPHRRAVNAQTEAASWA
jgi:hypothetical protein